MRISWITSLLGTGPFPASGETIDATVIDVRDLVDKAGNNWQTVLKKIELGATALGRGEKVVVCCDYGMSRSNAVAAGILSVFEKRDFEESLRLVLQATGETQIKIETLMAVRAALGLMEEKKKPGAKRSILVTGGSGFLGRALRKAIGVDFNVVAPPRTEIDLTHGNTLLDLLVGKENVDCIVHLANPRIYTSNMAMGQTLTMLRNVIDVCLSRDVPLVYPSGWEIYSGYSGVMNADEATRPLPKGPYGETKYLSETLIGHWVRTAGLRCTLLRSSPVYGKGSDRPKFIYNFIEKAIQSKLITTHRYTNGDPALDLLYVDDLAKAMVAVIASGFIGALNLGTGILTSTSQVARMIVDKLHSASPIEQSLIDTEVACIAMDWRHARDQIGWEPEVSLEKGLDLILSNT